MSSFGVAVLVIGLVVSLTAGGLTIYAVVKERRARQRSRERLKRLVQRTPDGDQQASTNAPSADIDRLMQNLTVRDYVSDPDLARQADEYFARVKARDVHKPEPRRTASRGHGSSTGNRASSEEDEDAEDRQRWLDAARQWAENRRIGSLRKANLQGADLSGVDLQGADLTGASLEDADLSNANLYMSDLTRARLTGANLHGANLWGAIMLGTELDSADLRDAHLGSCTARVSTLYRADMRGADLSGANFQGARFQEANASEAILEHTTLSDADMRRCRLINATLRQAIVTNTDLSEADLSAADAQEAALDNCALVRTTLRDTDFGNAKVVTRCDFEGAEIEGLKLSGANVLDDNEALEQPTSEEGVRGTPRSQSNPPV